jgi:hypothetical protein
MEDSIWFPPANVIYHGALLEQALTTEEKKSKDFRKVIEAVSVAQMLVAVMVKENRNYWMQLVDDKYGSPDIKTIRYAGAHKEKFDLLEQVDVEVVEYESHSSMSIPQFLVDTKLSRRKSYDSDTIILCHVGSGVKGFLPNAENIKDVIGSVNSPCKVVLLVGANPEVSELSLFSLNPEIGLILKYNPILELQKREKQTVMIFKFGVRKPPVYNPNDNHYPFEKLGYVPNENGDYE